MTSDPTPEPTVRIDDRVNPVWKYVALALMGLVLGAAPSHLTMLWNSSHTLTLAEVDSEIGKDNAALVQQVKDLSAKIDDLAQRIETRH